MDMEEGVEVVWNEVQFSERKNFKSQEEKIQQVFENLTQLEHPNIVKFHRYWTDTHNDKPRVGLAPYFTNKTYFVEYNFSNIFR
jgi:nuclear receptor-binding protein